jgi:hypothetical protein
MKVCSGLLRIFTLVSLLAFVPVEKSNASFINAGTEPTQIAHMGAVARNTKYKSKDSAKLGK